MGGNLGGGAGAGGGEMEGDEGTAITLAVRGCSQNMSAKNGGVPTPSSPICQLCQHLPNPPSLFCISFVNVLNDPLILYNLFF